MSSEGITAHVNADVYRFVEEVALSDCLDRAVNDLCKKCRALVSLPGAAKHLCFFELCDACVGTVCAQVVVREEENAEIISNAVKSALLHGSPSSASCVVVCVSRYLSCYQALVCCCSAQTRASEKRGMIANRAYFDYPTICPFIGTADDVYEHAAVCQYNLYSK